MPSNLVFQILDILSSDEIIDDDTKEHIRQVTDEETSIRFTGPKSRLLIHLFGRTATGTRICVDVEGFCPYFYVEVPESATSPTNLRVARRQLVEYIQRHCSFAPDVTTSIELREKFFGYTNHRSYSFIKLTVTSLRNFNNLRQLFLDKTNRPSTKGSIGTLWGKHAPSIYESNLDPMLRFLHTQNIQPCGWVEIEGVSESSDIIRTYYMDINPTEAPMAAAPFITISWDIECFSSCDDFPKPKKDYIRVAKDLYDNAKTGPEAIALIEEAMVWTGPADVRPIQGSKMNPIICKHRLPPDARATFKAVMNKDSVYSAIEKYLNPSNKDRDEAVEALNSYLNQTMGSRFPISGDPIIQIGAVVAVSGSVTERHIFVYPSCDPVDGAIVHAASSEARMLQSFFEWLEFIDADILIGYNVFGFDEKYVWHRLEELGLESELSVQALNRLCETGGQVKLKESFLSSSALGDNYFYTWTCDGRLQIDLLGYVKRTMSLESYKLDDVAKTLMSGAIISLAPEPSDGFLELTIKGAVKDIRVGRALKLLDESGEAITGKLEVVSVSDGGKKIIVTFPICDPDEWISIKEEATSWVITKDDVGPADIFNFHCGSDADRAKVAKYCIQDCDLVLELYKKLETFMNAMAMANVCSVPVSYIFTRGQGIKIESLIAKECLELNKCILTLPSPTQGPSENSYEGAIVLDPIPSFYNRSPIGVGDFASLYPSSIVSENISHDTLVWVKDFDDDGYLIKHVWGSNEFDNLEDVDYTDIKYDLLIPDPADKRKTPRKIKAGTRICRYAQDKAGMMPIIIKKLLAARKAKRNEAAKETDPLRATLLDTEQLAYKTTANSLYGQLGSGTFKMRLQDLAASTTAYGRLQIMFAKAVIEKFYGPESGDKRCGAVIMYGDTDSLFIEFNPYNPITGERLTGREAREAAINLTIEAGHLVSHALKAPHDFEFDKVYDPLLMFSKKRYAGKMFESNPDDFVYKYMGIALKRRDNAPIVKKIYGTAMKMILDHKDVAGATEYVQNATKQLVEGSTALGLLTITKSLKAEYKNPQGVAHKVLADRMTARDPGSAPSAGDRIGYVYIKPPTGQAASKLQGDRIETPAYVRANPGTEIDAMYYIDHQIKVPISQMFGLLLEDMPGYNASMLPSNFDEFDMERQLSEREFVAEKILFSGAIASAHAMAERRFISTMFPGAKVTSKTSNSTKPKTVVTTTASVTKIEPKKVQSRLSNYFQNRELAKAMKKIVADSDGSSTGSRSSGGGAKKK